ncbi:MAG: EI24 domain-containing protein [Rickettsiales bacterium]|nr:EI24 domain-containing protein [Rickettsiales bacterium]
MELVFRSAIKAIDDFKAPGMVKLFFMCLGLTALAAGFVIMVGVSMVQSWLGPWMPSGDTLGFAWLGWIADFIFWGLSVAAFVVPAFLIFWSLMIFIASFFDEHIAEKIETHRYPKMALGTNQPFWQEIRHDILFVLKTIFLNLLLVIIPLFWPFWPLLFPALNAYLLGTYFFMMAGGRHVGKKEAKKLAKTHRWKVMGAGLLIVIASGIPFLNLLVPFWGVAMMVHLYHLVDNPQIVEQLPAS